MKVIFRFLVPVILSACLFSSCTTQSVFRAKDGATAALDEDFRDQDSIELRFRIQDKRSGDYLGGWNARIDAYELKNKASAHVVTEVKNAAGKVPTVEFRLTSGEMLPPNTGYRVFLTRYNQPGIAIEMMDYFERISISKDITYRLD
jgi:hypothetical protein